MVDQSQLCLPVGLEVWLGVVFGVHVDISPLPVVDNQTGTVMPPAECGMTYVMVLLMYYRY